MSRRLLRNDSLRRLMTRNNGDESSEKSSEHVDVLQQIGGTGVGSRTGSRNFPRSVVPMKSRHAAFTSPGRAAMRPPAETTASSTAAMRPASSFISPARAAAAKATDPQTDSEFEGLKQLGSNHSRNAAKSPGRAYLFGRQLSHRSFGFSSDDDSSFGGCAMRTPSPAKRSRRSGFAVKAQSMRSIRSPILGCEAASPVLDFSLTNVARGMADIPRPPLLRTGSSRSMTRSGLRRQESFSSFASSGSAHGYNCYRSASTTSHTPSAFIEISPGHEVRLRGAQETWECIERDFYAPVQCLGCTKELCCIQDADYVLCPACRVVSPSSTGKRVEGMDGGVGLGFTYDDLMRWQLEIICARQQARY